MGSHPMFECRPIVKGSCIASDPSYFTSDEADAVAWSKANATRDCEQVTVEVCDPADVSTFAIRHFKHGGFDTGWRAWRDGSHIGTVTDLDRLFHMDTVAS